MYDPDGARKLVAAILMQAVKDLQGSYYVQDAVTFLQGPGAELAELAFDVDPDAFRERIDQLAERHTYNFNLLAA